MAIIRGRCSSWHVPDYQHVFQFHYSGSLATVLQWKSSATIGSCNFMFCIKGRAWLDSCVWHAKMSTICLTCTMQTDLVAECAAYQNPRSNWKVVAVYFCQMQNDVRTTTVHRSYSTEYVHRIYRLIQN